MSESDPETGGWLDSFRRISDSLMALLRSRVELFSVELQEEKLRALDLFIRLAIALTLGAAGLMIALGTLALWLWNTTGYTGLIVLALVVLGAAGFIVYRIHKEIVHSPPPFAETVAEFKKDGECFRKQ